MLDEKTRVLDSVRKRLPTEGLDILPLTILIDEVRKEDDWWYVPIQSASTPKRSYPYYEILAEMEEALEQEDHLDVILVPVYPD